MRYAETSLRERHRWPWTYYVARIWQGTRVVTDRLFLIPKGKAYGEFLFLEKLSVIYTDHDLTPFMETIGITCPLRENRRMPCPAISYERFCDLCVDAGTFEFLARGPKMESEGEAFDEMGTCRYHQYRVDQGGISVLRVMLSVDDSKDALLLAEKDLDARLDAFLQLPKAAQLPEPLRDVVYEQYESLSGMVFLENGPEFRDAWPVGRLWELKRQIEEYGLAKVLELSVDPEHLDQVPDGEPVITAYPDLARQFNFI